MTPWCRYAASIIATVGLSPAGVENEPVIVLRNVDVSGTGGLPSGGARRQRAPWGRLSVCGPTDDQADDLGFAT